MSRSKVEAFVKSALENLGIEEKVDFKIDLAPRKEFGDYASNVAIVYGKKLSRSPFEFAQEIVKKIEDLDQGLIFTKIAIAPPGFINFFLNNSFLQRSLLEIQSQDRDWGKQKPKKGTILLEFVSANPTGPLHVGHGRWAVVGDVISRLLSSQGYQVEREYYVNDVGGQIEKLVESVMALQEGRDLPEGGYAGDYVKEIIKQLGADKKGLSSQELRDNLLNKIIEEQKKTLENLGVKFDRWFYESELHAKNQVKWAIDKLHEQRKTFEEDGALWFKSQELGDDKNRVLIRADGQTTYFAADIAYHLDKFSRGYDQIINLWGTDHHGYVGRLKAAMVALGLPAEKLEIIIGQLVTLYRGKEAVRMSKRTGEMVTLQEVLDEIGRDATRFFFSSSAVNSHLDFDLELAKKQSNENPVFYVQYAHARICSILRKSNQEPPSPLPEGEGGEGSLAHPAERELMLKLLSWPDVVLQAALLRHPHRITEYGRELAVKFHSFYEQCRVLGNPARLVLVNSTRITLHNVLELLGVSSPESM